MLKQMTEYTMKHIQKLSQVFRIRYCKIGNHIVIHQYISNEAALSEPLYIAGMWRHCN